MRIGFIGLGNMGGPMARNLAAAGHAVQGFDLAAPMPEGVTAAATAAEAAAGAEVVITMLPNGQILRAVAAEVIPFMQPGAVLCDCSTVDVDSARSVAADCAVVGLGALDAPVSGGIGGAAAGTLTFMVGGSDAQLARAQPLLEKMGANIFHAGGVGAGQTAKICNNMLLGILMVGTSEAIALGVANGLDPKVLSEIMRRSSGGNWALEKYNPFPGVHENAPASKGYAGGFGTDLMLKDLGLSQENATAVRASTPLGGLARSLYAAHSLAGNGALDFSSILQMVQKR